MLSRFPLPSEDPPPEYDRIAEWLAPWTWDERLQAHIAPVKPIGVHRWDFAIPGERFKALPILRAWPDDLIAFDPTQPSKWRFWTGEGWWLGLEQYRDGVPPKSLILAPCPLIWVASGCKGLCPLRNDALLDLFPLVDEIEVYNADHGHIVKSVFAANAVPCPKLYMRKQQVRIPSLAA